jgi:glutamate---cysteine ligase / carboxylate-amine ligase
MANGDYTIGVEEEFLIVDGESRALRPRAEELMATARETLGDAVDQELHRSQLELKTPACASLAGVRSELTRLRRELTVAIRPSGSQILASGTHPFSVWREDPGVSPKYQRLERDYQQLAREQIICGCHVHVGIGDEEAAIEVMNRVRPWLSPILALAANSPFWEGDDTGYASYRTELWRRWPMAGTPEPFASRDEYEAVVDALFATGSIDDHARIYWDVRPSARFPTLEFRVTDVCLTVDDAVMVAGLIRGLVRACYEQSRAGEPVPEVRPELIRAATWRAARYGLDADLVDLLAREAVPAGIMVDRLLDFVGPGLHELGDWEEVSGLVKRTFASGTGAARQRAVLARTGRLHDVVDYIVAETAAAG